MIKIERPAKVPTALTQKGAVQTKKDCDDFTRDKATFMDNFTVDSTIYNAKPVKRSLKAAQKNKCCFCEKDQIDEYGAVEHYRPKSGYKIDKSEKELTKPGYYWLAYDWDNLLFVCGPCNTSYKQNFFPLEDESRRAKSHKDDIKQERPLLLDPCGKKNPRDHIYFQDNFPMYKDKFGQKTIEICGLDRDELNEKRQKLMNDIETRLALLSRKEVFNAGVVSKARQFIIDCQKPEAEFSSMAKDFLSGFNLVIT